MRGLENPHQLEVSVDGQRVHLASFGGESDFKASLQNPTAAGDDVDNRFTVRVPVKAGARTIGVAFLQNTAPAPWRLQPFLRSSNDTLDPTGWPHIDRFTITGPFNPTGPGDTPSRQRVFVCRPTGRADEEPCARKIISTLGRRGTVGSDGCGPPTPVRVLRDGAQEPILKADSARLQRILAARSSHAGSNATRRPRTRRSLSHQRSRTASRLSFSCGAVSG